MCYIINSENLLLNYFFNKNSAHEISYKSLREIRKKIEEKFDDAIYVDITYHSLYEAVSKHKNMLDMGRTKIKLTSNDTLNEDYIENNINYNLPSRVKTKYLNLLNDL